MPLLTALLNYFKSLGANRMVRERGRGHGDDRDRREPQDGFSWNEVPPWVIMVLDKQDLNNRLLQRVLREQEILMGTWKDMGDAIARNTDASNSIVTMLEEVVQKLKDAQAANDPAAMDAAIQGLDANTNRLAAAATKNTNADPNPGQPIPPAPPEPAGSV